MQFLPEDKKKRTRSIIILSVLIIGIIYINVFGLGFPGGGSDAADTFPLDENGLPVLPGLEQGTPNSAGVPGAVALPSVFQSVDRLLPYGTSFDTTVLDSEQFRALRDVPVLRVLPEELGKSNPFE